MLRRFSCVFCLRFGECEYIPVYTYIIYIAGPPDATTRSSRSTRGSGYGVIVPDGSQPPADGGDAPAPVPRVARARPGGRPTTTARSWTSGLRTTRCGPGQEHRGAVAEPAHVQQPAGKVLGVGPYRQREVNPQRGRGERQHIRSLDELVAQWRPSCGLAGRVEAAVGRVGRVDFFPNRS